ncbi:MAG: MFS transporter [Acidimicrobiales bacterium]|nr:MFS transporter [Acidimicrobiales bacterium]
MRHPDTASIPNGSDPTPKHAHELLVEDALLDGDSPFRHGTARAALAYPTFRRVYLGSLLSNIGSWMQNVILGAYVYHLTGSASSVALITLAQLGPLLVLSMVGGAIADRFDRRKVLILVSLEQLLFSLAIAVLVTQPSPSLGLLLTAVLAIGIGQAIYAPSYSALIPTLVAPIDMPGAISLNSANMNLSRVIGPAIGGVLFAKVGASWVFLGNAFTYLFVIAALWGLHFERPERPENEGRLQGLLDGLRVAARDGVIGRCLSTMVLFSFFCLPVAVLMPVVAHDNLGLEERSAAYGFLYASFGLGAVVGALSIGTFLAHRDLRRIVRYGLGGFAVSLATFALLRVPALGYPVVFILGCCYFATVTSLSTVLQQQLDDAVRGRVMALWIMAFGGTVPIGAMVAGPVSDLVGITAVLVAGAVVAAALVLYADLRPDPSAPDA